MFHSFNSFIQQCNTHFYSHRTIETHSNVINPSTRFFFLFSNPHYWRNRYGNKAKCYQLTTYFLVVVGVNSLVLNYLFLILHDSFFFYITKLPTDRAKWQNTIHSGCLSLLMCTWQIARWNWTKCWVDRCHQRPVHCN